MGQDRTGKRNESRVEGEKKIRERRGDREETKRD
jgi:hypothetical protein